MAEEFGSEQEKTEEPSLNRIEEFRKRGEVASSKELTSVLVLSASVLTLVLGIVAIYEILNEFMIWIYNLNIASAFTEKSLKTIILKTIMTGLSCVAPIAIATIFIVILANLGQIGFLFSPEILELKWMRIDPIQGLKRLFSIRSLVEAIKGFFKFLFILSIVYFFIKDKLATYKGFLHIEFIQTALQTRSMLAELCFFIILGLFIIALGDLFYQKMSYRKKLMMTKEQVKEETKEKEGNPEIKQRVRSIQRDMATRRMMNDVKKADVIVTNPTHISVALQYDQDTMVSPQVVAKGADHLALQIRKVAQSNQIPLVENVSLARTMYKTVKIGRPIPHNLYKAVAEVLAFVYKLKNKKLA